MKKYNCYRCAFFSKEISGKRFVKVKMKDEVRNKSFEKYDNERTYFSCYHGIWRDRKNIELRESLSNYECKNLFYPMEKVGEKSFQAIVDEQNRVIAENRHNWTKWSVYLTIASVVLTIVIIILMVIVDSNEISNFIKNLF